MRVIVMLGLLALSDLVRSEATAEPAPTISQQLPRSAKMGDQRAEYYAKKYVNRPRTTSSNIAKEQSGQPSVPVPAYTAPERVQAPVPAYSAPERVQNYSPYLVEGPETGASVRGNDTARFFGLSTSTQDLQLGLQFTVPFLSIPLGSLMGQYADWSSLVSVNWPSLVALGVVLLLAMVLLPWIITKLGGSTTGLPSFLNLGNLGNLGGYGRADDGGDSTPTLMARLDDTLAKYDIDSTACMQRGVCTYVREAALSVKEGRAESNDLLLDGLVSNSYINSWLNGTSIQEATQAGRSGANCGVTYPKCPLTANSVARAIAKFIASAV